VARAEGDAPDIDGRVYLRGSQPQGTFAWVTVTGHTDYDLIAEPALTHPEAQQKLRPNARSPVE
jgi:hypothetical protein